jgi:hypothetical protein
MLLQQTISTTLVKIDMESVRIFGKIATASFSVCLNYISASLSLSSSQAFASRLARDYNFPLRQKI